MPGSTWSPPDSASFGPTSAPGPVEIGRSAPTPPAELHDGAEPSEVDTAPPAGPVAAAEPEDDGDIDRLLVDLGVDDPDGPDPETELEDAAEVPAPAPDLEVEVDAAEVGAADVEVDGPDADVANDEVADAEQAQAAPAPVVEATNPDERDTGPVPPVTPTLSVMIDRVDLPAGNGSHDVPSSNGHTDQRAETASFDDGAEADPVDAAHEAMETGEQSSDPDQVPGTGYGTADGDDGPGRVASEWTDGGDDILDAADGDHEIAHDDSAEPISADGDDDGHGSIPVAEVVDGSARPMVDDIDADADADADADGVDGDDAADGDGHVIGADDDIGRDADVVDADGRVAGVDDDDDADGRVVGADDDEVEVGGGETTLPADDRASHDRLGEPMRRTAEEPGASPVAPVGPMGGDDGYEDVAVESVEEPDGRLAEPSVDLEGDRPDESASDEFDDGLVEPPVDSGDGRPGEARDDLPGEPEPVADFHGDRAGVVGSEEPDGVRDESGFLPDDGRLGAERDDEPGAETDADRPGEAAAENDDRAWIDPVREITDHERDDDDPIADGEVIEPPAGESVDELPSSSAGGPGAGLVGADVGSSTADGEAADRESVEEAEAADEDVDEAELVGEAEAADEDEADVIDLNEPLVVHLPTPPVVPPGLMARPTDTPEVEAAGAAATAENGAVYEDENDRGDQADDRSDGPVGDDEAGVPVVDTTGVVVSPEEAATLPTMDQLRAMSVELDEIDAVLERLDDEGVDALLEGGEGSAPLAPGQPR